MLMHADACICMHMHAYTCACRCPHIHGYACIHIPQGVFRWFRDLGGFSGDLGWFSGDLEGFSGGPGVVFRWFEWILSLDAWIPMLLMHADAPWMHAYQCCLCMQIHAYPWIRMHTWGLQMHAYLWICMHAWGYACRCMHVHAYACISIDGFWVA